MKNTQKILVVLNFLSKQAEAMITQKLLAFPVQKQKNLQNRKKKRKRDINHTTKFHAYFSLWSFTRVSGRDEQQRFKMQPSTG